MSGDRLCNSRLQNEDAFKFYVNVFIHCENQSIVEAHMMVLAQHSPFCHRFFMSRKELKVADMFFTTMKHSVVEAAIGVKFPLTPMGVLAPGSARARPSAQPPIDGSGNFPARVSVKSH